MLLYVREYLFEMNLSKKRGSANMVMLMGTEFSGTVP